MIWDSTKYSLSEWANNPHEIPLDINSLIQKEANVVTTIISTQNLPSALFEAALFFQATA